MYDKLILTLILKDEAKRHVLPKDKADEILALINRLTEGKADEINEIIKITWFVESLKMEQGEWRIVAYMIL